MWRQGEEYLAELLAVLSEHFKYPGESIKM